MIETRVLTVFLLGVVGVGAGLVCWYYCAQYHSLKLEAQEAH